MYIHMFMNTKIFTIVENTQQEVVFWYMFFFRHLLIISFLFYVFILSIVLHFKSLILFYFHFNNEQTNKPKNKNPHEQFPLKFPRKLKSVYAWRPPSPPPRKRDKEGRRAQRGAGGVPGGGGGMVFFGSGAGGLNVTFIGVVGFI